MTRGPENHESSIFGKVEETVLEHDPTAGYTKKRTIFLDGGYEMLSEKFEREVFDHRDLIIVPEEGITSIELLRVENNTIIRLNQSNGIIKAGFGIFDSEVILVYEGIGGIPILYGLYDEQNAVDYLTVHPLPRTLKRPAPEAKGIEEFLGEESYRTKNRAFLVSFAEQGFSYIPETGELQRETVYDQDFPLLERKFRVSRSSSGLITVNQQLMVPGEFSLHSATLPLEMPLEKTSLLRSTGKEWRNFFDEVGIKAEVH